MRAALVLAAVLAAGASRATAQAPAPTAPAAGPVVTYETEALRTGPLPPEVMQKIGPLHSLAAVEELLKQNRVSFAWAHAEMSSANLPPELVKQVNSLPPGEVFVLKQGQGWIMGVVLSKH